MRIVEKIPKPIRVGEYVPIYKPSPDVYLGEPTESFKPGERYDEWLVNDFSVLRDGDDWHIIGITHPRPRGFVDDFHFDSDVHEAEFQLFHATATASDFAELVRPGSFADRDKLLYPASRPGEGRELWAPHLLKRDGKFEIVYSPGSMRSAATRDFVEFERPRVLFESKFAAARDPYVFEEDGLYSFVWLDAEGLMLRTSEDFEHWSEPQLIFKMGFGGNPESPFLMKKDGFYYLFWCLHDGRNGCYDNRTFVYASHTLDGLDGTAPIAMLDAHAPEIVECGGKFYLLSVFYPENGISAAELAFI